MVANERGGGIWRAAAAALPALLVPPRVGRVLTSDLGNAPCALVPFEMCPFAVPLNVPAHFITNLRLKTFSSTFVATTEYTRGRRWRLSPSP